MFLPKDYKAPTSSNYMKLEEGDNKFRILSSAIVGWEWWVIEDQKPTPKRSKEMPQSLPQNIKVGEDGMPQKPKHFWAFVVFNYADEKVQILELTQSTVQKGIRALVADEDWGDPKEYDLVIKAEGKGKERKYNVTPKPKKPLDLTEEQATRVASINLDALYEGADPFADKTIDGIKF